MNFLLKRSFRMLQITKKQFDLLNEYGLIKKKADGSGYSNIKILNGKNSKSKTYYVYPDFEIYAALGDFKDLNLQIVTQAQIDKLIGAKLLDELELQKWGTYTPKALAFEDESGKWRIVKKAAFMKTLGFWK